MGSIYEFVKAQRDSYRTDTVEITDGYEFSQYNTLRIIDLYHNSRFESGPTDSLGREKPFYNVTKFRVNVATRATDLDTKDVQIQSDRPGRKAYIQSFVLSLKNRNWMKQSHLGKFLNRMGHTRAKYGGVMVKKTEPDNDLELHVVPWRDLITDQIDIRSGVKIERHYYTPAELKTAAPKGWKNIDDAITAAQKSKEAVAANPDQKENQTPGDYIEAWEVHGVLPTCYLRGQEGYADDYGSEDEYERQMHVIVLDESKNAQGEDEVTGVTLYGGLEDEDPYKYLEWEQVEGRGLGVGVVEDLFEAQVWTNYGVKQKKDMLDLAGKIVFQTSDSSIEAKNILIDLEQGQILTTAPQTTISQVNNTPSSIGGFDKLIEDWNSQAENVTSTYQAITGETMPSGTPFRLVAQLNREAGSMFVYRRQEAGLFIQEIYRDWVLPFIVKQIKKDTNLNADLQGEEIEMISEALAEVEKFKFAGQELLKGNFSGSPQNMLDMESVRTAARELHTKAGARRGFTLPKDFFEGWEGNTDVITTGEQEDKSAALETLFNLFQVIAKFPQALQDPVLARLFNQIVEKAGVSPLMFGTGRQSGTEVATASAASPTPTAPAPTNILPKGATFA